MITELVLFLIASFILLGVSAWKVTTLFKVKSQFNIIMNDKKKHIQYTYNEPTNNNEEPIIIRDDNGVIALKKEDNIKDIVKRTGMITLRNALNKEYPEGTTLLNEPSNKGVTLIIKIINIWISLLCLSIVSIIVCLILLIKTLQKSKDKKTK